MAQPGAVLENRRATARRESAFSRRAGRPACAAARTPSRDRDRKTRSPRRTEGRSWCRRGTARPRRRAMRCRQARNRAPQRHSRTARRRRAPSSRARARTGTGAIAASACRACRARSPASRATARGRDECTSWGVTASCSIASGVNLPSGVSAVRSFAPPLKNPGAPHSSTLMCAIAWQMIASVLPHIAARPSEFAAVPVNTKKTSHSVSNRSRIATRQPRSSRRRRRPARDPRWPRPARPRPRGTRPTSCRWRIAGPVPRLDLRLLRAVHCLSQGGAVRAWYGPALLTLRRSQCSLFDVGAAPTATPPANPRDRCRPPAPCPAARRPCRRPAARRD